MISKYIWIILLIVQCALVTPSPTQNLREDNAALRRYDYDAHNKPKDDSDEQVISVRITSSVAVVGGGKPKAVHGDNGFINEPINNLATTLQSITLDSTKSSTNDIVTITTEVSPKLIGANIEFIKQLNAKKSSTQGSTNTEQIHPFPINGNNKFYGDNHNLFKSKHLGKDKNYLDNPQDSFAEESLKILNTDINHGFDKIQPMLVLQSMDKIRSNRILECENQIFSQKPNSNLGNKENDDSIAEPSNKSIQTATNDYIEEENVDNVPLARSIPHSPSPKNYIQGLSNLSPSERGNSPSLTTVSFNVMHDTPSQSNSYNKDSSNSFTNTNRELNRFYETPKVYSEPAKIYSEPAKIYSEPAKIYSEPAKIYSEPAKIYSEPAKIYSEPAKFYSEPASLHLSPGLPNYTPWQSPSTAITSSPWPYQSQNSALSSTLITTTPTTINNLSTGPGNLHRIVEQQPEKNYEVDEKISVLTDGRSHGVQETSTEKCKQDNCKVGYVVEGRQYKKYRVEERTPDGFIVGEYGVVRNEDGALRGVRYTADGDASPRLIYDALMKFLQLK